MTLTGVVPITFLYFKKPSNENTNKKSRQNVDKKDSFGAYSVSVAMIFHCIHGPVSLGKVSFYLG